MLTLQEAIPIVELSIQKLYSIVIRYKLVPAKVVEASHIYTYYHEDELFEACDEYKRIALINSSENRDKKLIHDGQYYQTKAGIAKDLGIPVSKVYRTIENSRMVGVKIHEFGKAKRYKVNEVKAAMFNCEYTDTIKHDNLTNISLNGNVITSAGEDFIFKCEKNKHYDCRLLNINEPDNLNHIISIKGHHVSTSTNYIEGYLPIFFVTEYSTKTK